MAAAELGITQSAVSHAVGALERTVGAPVLHRNATAATPTTLGARLLDHARSALAATEAIGDLAAAQHGPPRGTVRLAAPPTVCQGMLPKLMADWRARLPRVTIRVFEGENDEVADSLSALTVEAAVLVDPPRSTPGVLLGTDTFHALLRRDIHSPDRPSSSSPTFQRTRCCSPAEHASNPSMTSTAKRACASRPPLTSVS